MKYKKFWAFLLCLSMLVSMFEVSVIAEENETGSEFAAADMDEAVPPKTSDTENETDHHATSPAEGDEAVPPETSDTENETDYNAMSPADLYAALKAMDGGKAKEVYQTLTDDTLEALYEYEDSLETDEPTLPGGPAENFTNVAPLVEAGSENLPARSAMPMKAPLRSTARMAAASASAPPSQSAPITKDGLVTSKTVTQNENGGYDITLEAYTTGTVHTITDTVPADIVLVLDVSGSMREDYTTYTPVLGGIYSISYSTYFGFSDYDSEYYIKLSDGTYQEVHYAGNDTNGFDYYRYNNGNQHVYLYPQLADGTTTEARKHGSFDVEQFYVRKTSTNSKLDALKEAVNAFITSTKEQNEGVSDDKENRISIVKFAGNENQAIGNDTYDDNYNYTQIVEDLTSDMEGLHNAVGDLTAGGATAIDYGLQFANNVLTGTELGDTQLRGARKDANKVVIVFTDGEPNHYSGFDVNVANSALAAANSLKTANATVYTICIAGGAQVNAGGNLPTGDENINRFMHLLSSNYPNSTSMDTVGENGSTGVRQADGTYKSYYLTPADGDGLTDVFESISEQIGNPTISLDTSTVIKDVVSQYFKLPTEPSAVTVKSVPCRSYNDATGVADWESTGPDLGNAVTLDAANNTVNVSGFDFDKNFVSANGYEVGNPQGAGSYHGSKLVITFSIGVKDGFLGGNNVPTNDEASGVYSNSEAVTPLATFIVPTVNVPINQGGVNFGGTEQIIYYGGAVDPLYTGIDQTQDSWRFDYVNIDYITPDVSNSKCGAYTVSATIAPKYDGSPPENSSVSGAKAESRTLTGTSQVHVLVPTATWNDETIYLGSTAQYDDPTISWNDEGNHDLNNRSAAGEKPVTVCEYSQTAGIFEDCTTVTPTIKLAGTAFNMPAFTVHVLKPEITWQDGTCYFGAAFPKSFEPVNISWKDSSNDGGTTDLPAPTLTYTFTNDITENADLMPNRDVNIRVFSVKIGSSPTDYRDDVTFSWQSNADCPSCDDPNPEHQFRIHPLTCTLTITKSCANVASNDSFIFTVKGSGNKFASKMNGMKVAVMGAGSATVTGLPIGSYTVTENTDWSWRYTPANGGLGSATLLANSSGDTANVIIGNTLSKDQWLSGSCYAVNRWTENGIVVERSRVESIVTQLVHAVKNVF